MKNLFLLVLLGAFIPAKSFAFRLTPMVVHFLDEGAKATQVLTLDNNGSEKVPVQIEVKTREVGEDGQEIRNKTEGFTIYPEQIVLLPNEKRNVRITWTGADNKENKTSIEKSFRIIASQLPLEFREQNSKPKANGASLNFLIQYVASAYVSPPNGEAKIKVTAAKLLKPKSLELVLNNTGNIHQVMKIKALKIFSKDKKLMEIKTVKELEAENILAGAQRKFTIGLPKEITAKDISAQVEFEDFAD